MSNVFITDIEGTGTYAIPASDAALASATAGLTSLIGDLGATLSYKRILAWVDDAGGPDGAEGVRTLNCLVEQFVYNSEECPDATETATFTAALSAALIGDHGGGNTITGVGDQQVHINLKEEYYFWDRDSGSEFVYLEEATDDIGVGGAVLDGKWFQDGDLVLNANAMSGAEVLRVVGTERIEGGLLMTEQAVVPPAVAPGAGEGTWWVFDNGASVNVPYFTDDTPTGYQLAYDGDGTSLYNVQQVLFVDKTGSVYVADGSIQKPYNSINAAITAANALSPGASNRIGIIIYPGVYNEALVTQDDYVDLIGFDRQSTIIAPTSANSPLDMRHVNVAFHNLTFETPSGNTDYIVDELSVTQGRVTFTNCSFLGTNGSANNYFRSRFKEVVFYDCVFLQGSTNLLVFSNEQSTVVENRFHSCKFDGVFQSFASGQLNNYFFGCKFTSTANSGIYYGTVRINASNPKLHFFDCYIENTHVSGYPVLVNSGSGADFYGCRFESASSYDIEGNATTVGLYGCPMSKGMSQWVRTRNKVKYCNGSSGDKDYHTDFYGLNYSLQSADDGAIIYFLGDYTTNFQVDQNDNIDITIDGQGYTWTDTAPTSGFTLGNVGGGKMVVRNMNFIGCTVYCQGSGSHLVIDNCYIEGHVYQRGVGDDATTKTVIHDSTVIGIAGGASVGSPLSINSTLPTIIVSKSYLKGYTGYAAVNYLGVDNDNLKIEYSKLFHGDLGTNNPFTGVGAFVINYAAHHTTFNQEPALAAPASYVNDIDSGQRHNTIDPDGDFAVMNVAF